MSRKVISALAAAAVLFTTPVTVMSEPVAAPAAAPAAASPADLDARKVALVKRYMAAAHMDEMLGKMAGPIRDALVTELDQENSDLPKYIRDAIVDSAVEAMPAMMDDMMKRMIPLIASTYTEQELIKMTEFIETPEGQSMMAKAPLLSAAMIGVMRQVLPGYEQDMVKRLCGKIDCKSAKLKGLGELSAS